MTTIEILKRARELIATPERWAHQNGLLPVECDGLHDPRVTARCLALAIESVQRHARDARAALGFESWSEMHAWNDAPERTHAEVLARLDDAIARLS